MFQRLAEFFKGEVDHLLEVEGGEPTPEELRVAVAIILLEMAGRDGDYAPEEVRTIFTTMELQFQMSTEETHSLLNMAENLRSNKERVNEFMGTIRKKFGVKQRELIMAMAWNVVIADGEVEESEERFLEQIRNRLALDVRSAQKAKRMALDGM